jgi:hypothetical protein
MDCRSFRGLDGCGGQARFVGGARSAPPAKPNRPLAAGARPPRPRQRRFCRYPASPTSRKTRSGHARCPERRIQTSGGRAAPVPTRRVRRREGRFVARGALRTWADALRVPFGALNALRVPFRTWAGDAQAPLARRVPPRGPGAARPARQPGVARPGLRAGGLRGRASVEPGCGMPVDNRAFEPRDCRWSPVGWMSGGRRPAGGQEPPVVARSRSWPGVGGRGQESAVAARSRRSRSQAAGRPYSGSAEVGPLASTAP